jgi:predicted ATP-grasp superfamily ATP-dependent carboligase
MQYADEEPGDYQFGQEYIEGEDLSVSLVGSRITGETCLYYSENPPYCLAVNRQDVKIQPNGQFMYCGGETPITHPHHDEIVGVCRKAFLALGCQGYVGIDLIVSADRIVVVDVNPRPTGSIIGISHTINEEIGSILLDASYGKEIAPVTHLCRVKFNKKGNITETKDL